MRRPPIPSSIAEVFEDPAARSSLLVGAAALVAAALDPKVWGPSQPTVQAAIRARPELEVLVLVAAVAGSALLLTGGAIGDSSRVKPLIVGGLLVELLAAGAWIAVPTGALFVITRFIGHAAAAFVIPASLALVAVSYRGITRATAIGLAYGAYAGAGAAGPILLQILPGRSAPAFVVAIVACLGALWLARRRLLDLPRPTNVERPYVIGTAIWAFGIIVVTVGLAWLGGGWQNPLRWALIIGGSMILGLAVLNDRRRRQRTVGAIRIDRRPVAIAVFVGVVLAMAQTAALVQLPLYFQLVQRYGPLLSILAVGPLFAALVVAGPVAGILLARFTPRWLVGIGAIAVGLGNVLVALIATPSASYLMFVIPFLLIGAGFVVATTVRTAIIFASIPRGLPATAAALNESSIAVGGRIGIVVVTAIVAEVAVATYAASVAGLPPSEADRAIAAFRDILIAIGTPSFSEVTSTLGSIDTGPYLDAYATGVRVALGLSGLAALIVGAIAWGALGRRDPLATVYDLQDERTTAGD